MGLFSSITSTISKAYTSVDKAIGGVLPAGYVAPKKETTTVTKTQPKTYGVTVTDYSSGASKKTVTTSSGTTTTYRPAPSSSGGGASSPVYLGGGVGVSSSGLVSMAPPQSEIEQAIEVSKPKTSTAPATDTGKIQPLPKQVSALEYTGEPLPRYEKPLGSAIKESISNVLNVGIIGKKGISPYLTQAFITPFAYVGKPKAYQSVGIEFAKYGKTELGGTYTLGIPKEQFYKEGTLDKTFYEVSEEQRKGLYEEAGLKYKGEPVSVLPLRLGEQVTSEILPKYEERLKTEQADIFKYYQTKVDIGELSVSQAEKQMATVLDIRAKTAEAQFQKELTATYGARVAAIPDLSKRIGKISSFRASIGGDTSTQATIKVIGRGIEAGAIGAATLVGGSGITLAASTYIGVGTAKRTVSYVGDYSTFTTKQKIIGAGGIAAGAAATYYTFRLGTTRFYSEWRGIIYQDIAASPSKIRGVETLSTSKLSRFEIASLKTSGTGKALTQQTIDVYKTGTGRLGYFGRGVTKTTIYDPQYEKFITAKTPFTTAGFVPTINQLSPTTAEGYGKGYFRNLVTGARPEYQFYTRSQATEDFYRVLGAKPTTAIGKLSPSRLQFTVSDMSNTIRADYTPNIIRGEYTGSGLIAKYSPKTVGGTYIISGGGIRKSTSFTLLDLQKSTALASIPAAEQTLIKGLPVGVATSSRAISSQITEQGFKGITIAPIGATKQAPITRQLSYTIPSLSQAGIQRTKTKQKMELASASQFAQIPLSSVVQTTRIAPLQAAAPRLSQTTIQRAALRVKLLAPTMPTIPTFFTPSTIPTRTPTPPPLLWNFGDIDIGMPSTVLKGGKRRTGYVPSFSALVFNVKGTYKAAKPLSISGLDFRPITQDFRFKTGIGGKIKLKNVL